MSRVIKSDATGERVRDGALAFSARRSLLQRNDHNGAAPVPAAQTELARVSALLRAREAELEELRRDVDRIRRDAEEAGRKAGAAGAASHGEKLVATLKAQATAARDQLSQALGELERLAPLVAETALGRILEAKAEQKALVAQIIARQITEVGAQAIVAIEVSPKDFPTPQDLAALNQLGAAGKQPIEFRSIATLESGECRIKLRLGTLEIGPKTQWEALRNELRRIAQLKT